MFASNQRKTPASIFKNDENCPVPGQDLMSIRIDYGPRELLSEFFLRADEALRNFGVSLAFGTFDELMETNRTNRATWLPLVPTFDPANGLCDPAYSYVFIGRSPSGQIITAQGARIFDWRATNFKAEAESMRLFYSTEPPPAETCSVHNPTAASLRGVVAFLGGAWWHPQVRGRMLGSILSRVSRAYAYTRWHPDLTMAVMSRTLIAKGFASRNGYPHVRDGFKLRNFVLGDYDGAVVWIHRDELLQDLEAFSSSLEPPIARAHLRGNA